MDTNVLSLSSDVTLYADTRSMNDRVDVHAAAEDEQADVDDPCGAAHGILLSLVLSAPFWVLVYVMLL
jgi:murein tripeptide amidase MpaA